MKHVSKCKLTFAFAVCFLLTAHSQAAQAPLFTKGVEIFLVKDEKGNVPTFRILKDTPSDRAVALAVNSSINMQPDVKQKVPLTDYVDVKVEELQFTPAKNNKDLDLALQVSGHSLDLPKPVDRAKFLAGETISLEFPKKDQTFAVVAVTSNGKIRFRLNTETNDIQIEEATGHMTYNSPLLGEGEQSIHFTGRAIRKKL